MPFIENIINLLQMPPTIIWEAEFDMYITPATRLKQKTSF